MERLLEAVERGLGASGDAPAEDEKEK